MTGALPVDHENKHLANLSLSSEELLEKIVDLTDWLDDYSTGFVTGSRESFFQDVREVMNDTMEFWDAEITYPPDMSVNDMLSAFISITESLWTQSAREYVEYLPMECGEVADGKQSQAFNHNEFGHVEGVKILISGTLVTTPCGHRFDRDALTN